jgi:REP element-mobilizing transposase RayT
MPGFETGGQIGLVQMMIVKAQDFAPLQSSSAPNQFGPQSQNLASIIRGFKVGVTKRARLIQPGFMWQSRYYDHIIRNNKAYRNITEYIENNPANYSQ